MTIVGLHRNPLRFVLQIIGNKDFVELTATFPLFDNKRVHSGLEEQDGSGGVSDLIPHP